MRCSRGTRKSKCTNDCQPPSQKKYKRCGKGTCRNRNTENCMKKPHTPKIGPKSKSHTFKKSKMLFPNIYDFNEIDPEVYEYIKLYNEVEVKGGPDTQEAKVLRTLKKKTAEKRIKLWNNFRDWLNEWLSFKLSVGVNDDLVWAGTTIPSFLTDVCKDKGVWDSTKRKFEKQLIRLLAGKSYWDKIDNDRLSVMQISELFHISYDESEGTSSEPEEFAERDLKPQFKILGLPVNSTKEEAKKAYKKLVLLHHPDKGGNPKKFKEIKDAWDYIDESL